MKTKLKPTELMDRLVAAYGSQAAVAVAMRTSQASISRWRKGERPLSGPALELAIRLASAKPPKLKAKPRA